MKASPASQTDLALACFLIDEAATFNGGWLNLDAYEAWRSSELECGREVPSYNALIRKGIKLIKLARGLGIPGRPLGSPGEDPLKSIRDAHAASGSVSLSVSRYRRWCEENESAPSVNLLIYRFGTWNAVLNRAGVPISDGNHWYRDEDLKGALEAGRVQAVSATTAAA